MGIQTNMLGSYSSKKKDANFSIEKIPFKSPYDTSILHRHSFYQIIILKKGMGKHIVDFEQYEMNAPCTCVIFPQQIHKLELSPEAEGYIIMFDETIFCSEILSNELKEYNVDLQKNINFVDFTKHKSEFDSICNIVDNIEYLDSALNKIKKMQIKFFIKIIIFKIIDAVSDNVFTGNKSRDFETYIEFRKLVDIEFVKNRKVESYCKKLNISAKKLNSICRQYSDKTALSIIHDRLSIEIKKIFIFEDMSLKEIAFNFEFDSQSALNKYIATKFGCTPSELKEKVNNYDTKKVL